MADQTPSTYDEITADPRFHELARVNRPLARKLLTQKVEGFGDFIESEQDRRIDLAMPKPKVGVVQQAKDVAGEVGEAASSAVSALPEFGRGVLEVASGEPDARRIGLKRLEHLVPESVTGAAKAAYSGLGSAIDFAGGLATGRTFAEFGEGLSREWETSNATRGVDPRLSSRVDRGMSALEKAGIHGFEIHSGQRQRDEQMAMHELRKQGRWPYPAAHPDVSLHTRADLAAALDFKYAGDGEPDWDAFGQAMEAEGLEWGGRFQDRDPIHVQLSKELLAAGYDPREQSEGSRRLGEVVAQTGRGAQVGGVSSVGGSLYHGGGLMNLAVRGAMAAGRVVGEAFSPMGLGRSRGADLISRGLRFDATGIWPSREEGEEAISQALGDFGRVYAEGVAPGAGEFKKAPEGQKPVTFASLGKGVMGVAEEMHRERVDPESIAAKVGMVGGALPVGLAEAAAYAYTLGPIAGFALLGGLGVVEEDAQTIMLEMAKGGAIGFLFWGLSPYGRIPRGVTLGLAAPGVDVAGRQVDIALAEEGEFVPPLDPVDMALNGGVMLLLGGAAKARPRHHILHPFVSREIEVTIDATGRRVEVDAEGGAKFVFPELTGERMDVIVGEFVVRERAAAQLRKQAGEDPSPEMARSLELLDAFLERTRAEVRDVHGNETLAEFDAKLEARRARPEEQYEEKPSGGAELEALYKELKDQDYEIRTAAERGEDVEELMDGLDYIQDRIAEIERQGTREAEAVTGEGELEPVLLERANEAVVDRIAELSDEQLLEGMVNDEWLAEKLNIDVDTASRLLDHIEEQPGSALYPHPERSEVDPGGKAPTLDIEGDEIVDLMADQFVDPAGRGIEDIRDPRFTDVEADPEAGRRTTLQTKQSYVADPAELRAEMERNGMDPEVIERTLAEMAGEARPPDVFANAETGRPLEAQTFRGHGRDEASAVYAEGAEGATLGPGRYSTPIREDAQAYGPELEEVTVRLGNPYVLESDQQFVRMAGHQGMPYSNAERASLLRDFRQNVEAAGHDGIVVNIPKYTDSAPDGLGVKRIREIFHETQIVEFSPSETRVPGRPAALPPDPRIDQLKQELLAARKAARDASPEDQQAAMEALAAKDAEFDRYMDPQARPTPTRATDKFETLEEWIATARVLAEPNRPPGGSRTGRREQAEHRRALLDNPWVIARSENVDLLTEAARQHGDSGPGENPLTDLLWKRVQELEDQGSTAGALDPVRDEMAPDLEARVDALGGVLGAETEIVLPDGQRIPAVYAVVEAEAITASHDAGTFAKEPSYPEGIQPRTSYRQGEDSTGQMKVEQGANQWDGSRIYSDSPTATQGPPIILDNGLVLGGNGRTMMTKRVYQGESTLDEMTPAEGAMEHAEKFGIDLDVVGQMQAPIIVRVLKTDPGTKSDRAKLAQKMNLSETESYSEAELGSALAVQADETLAVVSDLVNRSRDKDPTARKILAGKPAVVKAMETDGIITAQNRNEMVAPQGALTDQGLRVAESLLIGNLVRDPETMARIPDYLRVKLLGIASPVARSEEMIPESVRPHVESAVVSEIARQAAGDPPMAVEDFVRQRSLLPGMEAPSQSSDVVSAIHQALVSVPAKELRGMFMGVATRMSGAGEGQGALFAAGRVETPREIIREVFDVHERAAAREFDPEAEDAIEARREEVEDAKDQLHQDGDTPEGRAQVAAAEDRLENAMRDYDREGQSQVLDPDISRMENELRTLYSELSQTTDAALILELDGEIGGVQSALAVLREFPGKPRPEDIYDAALFDVLHEGVGARVNWARIRREGIADKELKSLLWAQFHGRPTQSRDGWVIELVGTRDNPRIRIGTEAGELAQSIQGSQLRSKVRSILDLPRPDAAQGLQLTFARPRPTKTADSARIQVARVTDREGQVYEYELPIAYREGARGGFGKNMPDAEKRAAVLKMHQERMAASESEVETDKTSEMLRVRNRVKLDEAFKEVVLRRGENNYTEVEIEAARARLKGRLLDPEALLPAVRHKASGKVTPALPGARGGSEFHTQIVRRIGGQMGSYDVGFKDLDTGEFIHHRVEELLSWTQQLADRMGKVSGMETPVMSTADAIEGRDQIRQLAGFGAKELLEKGEANDVLARAQQAGVYAEVKSAIERMTEGPEFERWRAERLRVQREDDTRFSNMDEMRDAAEGEPQLEGPGVNYIEPRSLLIDSLTIPKEAMQPGEIMYDLAKGLGFTVNEGRVRLHGKQFGQRQSGTYQHRTERIDILRYGDIQALAHEVAGHGIVERHPKLRELYQKEGPIQDELKEMSYERTMPDEGLAEFFRVALNQKQSAALHAPLTYRRVFGTERKNGKPNFDGLIDSVLTKAEAKAIRHAQDRMHEFWGQSMSQGIRGMFGVGRTPSLGTMIGTRDWVAQAWGNNLHGYYKAEQHLTGEQRRYEIVDLFQSGASEIASISANWGVPRRIERGPGKFPLYEFPKEAEGLVHAIVEVAHLGDRGVKGAMDYLMAKRGLRLDEREADLKRKREHANEVLPEAERDLKDAEKKYRSWARRPDKTDAEKAFAKVDRDQARDWVKELKHDATRKILKKNQMIPREMYEAEIRKAPPEYGRLDQKLQEIARRNLEFYRDSGSITKQEYKAMIESEPEYTVPWFREIVASMRHNKRARGSHPGTANAIRTMGESTLPFRKDLINSLMLSESRMVEAAIRNEVKRHALEGLLEAPGSGNFLRRVPPDHPGVQATKRQIIEALERHYEAIGQPMPKDLIHKSEFPDFLLLRMEGRIPWGDNMDMFRDRQGKPVYVEYVDPLLARTVWANPDLVGQLAKRWNRVRQLWQDVRTSSPGYMSRIFRKEFIFRAGVTRAPIGHYLQDTVAGYKSALARDAEYRDAVSQGMTGGNLVRGVDLTARDVLRLARHEKAWSEGRWRNLPVSWDSIILTPIDGMRALRKTSYALEIGPRIAERRSALRRGDDPHHATYLAKSTMINYHRRGDAGEIPGHKYLTLAGSLIEGYRLTFPFGSARINGAINLASQTGLSRAFGYKGEPTAKLLTAARLTSLVVAGSALHAYNLQYEAYRDLPQWLRDSYNVIMIPQYDANGLALLDSDTGQPKFEILLQPSLWEVGAATAVFNRFIDSMLLEEDPNAQDLGIATLNLLTRDYVGVNNFMPVGLGMLVEQGMNRRLYRDAPIVSRQVEKLPPSAQYTRYTPKSLQVYGEALSKLRGTRRDIPLVPDWLESPQRIEHFLDSTFGEFHEYFLWAIEAGLDLEGLGRSTPWSSRPVIRSAYAPGDKYDKTAEDYYSLYHEVRPILDEMNNLYNRGDEEAVARADELAQSEAVAMAEELAANRLEISDIEREIREIYWDMNMPQDAKDREIRMLEMEKRILYQEALFDAKMAAQEFRE